MSTATPSPATSTFWSWSVSKTLCTVAFLLLVAAIILPKFVGDAWLTDNGAMIGLAKFVELILLIGVFGCVAAIGALRITSSERSNMEWFGTSLVFVCALFIGAFSMFKLVSVDEFASYRHLVSQRGARAVVEEPDMKMNWETGVVTFDVDEAFQWITVNVDYYDNDPMARKSKVFYHVPVGGTYQIPLFEKASRVGVFYGTGNGPSGEVFELNAEEDEKRAAAEAEALMADTDAAMITAIELAVKDAVRAAEDAATEKATEAKAKADADLKEAVEDALKAAAKPPGDSSAATITATMQLAA